MQHDATKGEKRQHGAFLASPWWAHISIVVLHNLALSLRVPVQRVSSDWQTVLEPPLPVRSCCGTSLIPPSTAFYCGVQACHVHHVHGCPLILRQGGIHTQWLRPHQLPWAEVLTWNLHQVRRYTVIPLREWQTTCKWYRDHILMVCNYMHKSLFCKSYMYISYYTFYFTVIDYNHYDYHI